MIKELLNQKDEQHANVESEFRLEMKQLNIVNQDLKDKIREFQKGPSADMLTKYESSI